jgi:hypothetical protein
METNSSLPFLFDARGPAVPEAETDSGCCLRRFFDVDRFKENSMIAGTGDHVVHLTGDDRQGDPNRIRGAVCALEVPTLPASQP